MFKRKFYFQTAVSTAVLSALGSILSTLPATAFPKHGSTNPPFRVVIDPGHGGTDEGSVFYQRGKKVTEKQLTLKLAYQAAKYLRAHGIQVVLTRSRDREVALPERTAIANRLGADIFISLHMNSTFFADSDAEGIETYILNNATDASSRRLAHLENSVIAPHAPASAVESDVALILKDLRLDANIVESKRLACQIQTSLVAATANAKARPSSKKRHRNRGVKQALFHVLLGADMPSVLVEAGFINSAYDRNLVLAQGGGQPTVGKAIAQAIEQYRKLKKAGGTSFAAQLCKMAAPSP